MFITAFTILKTWTQPKCSSTDECIKMVWYTHTYTRTGIVFSHKKEWNNAIHSNMDEVSENLSVVSNSSRPHGLYGPWNSPGQNTGVGSHSLLQGTWMDLEITTEEARERQIWLICGNWKTNKWTYLQNRDSQTQKTYGYQRGKQLPWWLRW